MNTNNFILSILYFSSNIFVVNSEVTFPIATILKLDPSGRPVRVLNKIPNSETIVNLKDRLLLRCTAAYPIQWVYSGNGAPELIRSASNEKTSNLYQSDLKIKEATEKHTGRYKCRSSEMRDLLTFYYIYVPGPELFTAEVGKEILYSPDDSNITIPCTVSQREAHVTLQKSIEDVLQRPIPVRYDPRRGFRLKMSELEDPSGTYVCSATYGNIFRLMEYTLIPRDSVNRVNVKSCKPSPCGKNTRCRLLGSIVTCSCIESFTGDPYSRCEKSCDENDDCPTNLYCNQKLKTCENPCENYPCDPAFSECKVTSHFPGCVQSSKVGQKSCGKKPACLAGSICQTVNGQPKCVCAKDFLGSPETGCYASCQNSLDCSSSKSCEYPICVDPCLKFNPCGQNAQCTIERHSRVCKCVEGYTGEPFQICHKIQEPEGIKLVDNSSQSQPQTHNACSICGPRSMCNLVNHKIQCSCKPGYSGSPPNCSPSCTSNQNCSSKSACLRGRCINPCGHSQTCGKNAECSVENHNIKCTCATGFEGNPYESCISEPDLTAPKDLSPRCPANMCNRRRVPSLKAILRNLGYRD